MLSESEAALIAKNAYVPEHLPQYFIPFSGMEPCLINNCIIYTRGNTVSFIGYPLVEQTEAETIDTLKQVIRDYNPSIFKAVLPFVPYLTDYNVIEGERDEYSRIDLNGIAITAKTRNMIGRGKQQFEVFIGQEFTMEHRQLLHQFVKNKNLNEDTANFFYRLPEFLSHSPTATLFEARSKETGSLAAYNVMEFSSGDYCFFLFNIKGNQHWPGVSDLLMDQMITMAKSRKKKYLNTGLSVNGGIRWFKSKWGAEVFLPYCFISAEPKLPWQILWEKWRKLFKR